MSVGAPRTPREIVETLLLDPKERRRLLGFARSRYRIPASEAEDILQETAVESVASRQHVWPPRGFLSTVFRARCSRYLSSRTIRESLCGREEDQCVEAADPHDGLDREVSLREALDKIST